MVSHIAEWISAVLAAGMITGLVVVAAGAVAVWWLYRRLRRCLEIITSTTGRYALQAAVVAAAAGRVRLPPQVVHDLRQRINGPPDVR